MKETVFILLVIGVLLGMTAIRYRRELAVLIGFYNDVKNIRSKLRETTRQPSLNDPDGGIQLVKCARCGKWIPQSEAGTDGREQFCADTCTAR